MSASIPGPPAADRIAHFLQRRFRDHARSDAQAWREARSLGNLDVVLRLALGLPVEFLDPSLRGPGAAAELERDAHSCITQCFFRDDATHYEVLGLSPDAPPESVRENFRLLMQLIHPDRQGAGAVWRENFAARANGAYAMLKVPETRTAYDSELAEARFREQAARGVAPTRSPSHAFGSAAGYRRRSVPAAASWPDWLALDVGGVVREHPVLSSLVAIVVGSASIIGVVAWEGRVAKLIRETRAPVVAERPPTPVARASSPETPGPEAWALAVPTGPSPVASAVSLIEVTPAHSVQAAAQPLPAKVPAARAAAAASTVDAARAVPAAVSAKREAIALRVPEPASPVAAGIGANRDEGAQPMPVANPSRAAGVPENALVAPERPVAPTEAAPVAAARPGASPSARASAAENPERSAPGVTAVAVAAPAAAAATSAAAGAATALPPATDEIEAFFAVFVESYEKGRLDSLAALFDDDAEMNLRRGRPAIRGEYDELFRLSSSRRMQLTRINWRRIGDRAHAKGEILVRIGWRDGRDVEQRIAVDMELVRRDGRALIARLSQQPRN